MRAMGFAGNAPSRASALLQGGAVHAPRTGTTPQLSINALIEAKPWVARSRYGDVALAARIDALEAEVAARREALDALVARQPG
ncbi:hypothetical protein ACF3M1_15640 [Luteimonas sp. WGS1318]|uniref:hypothetical protein n=1 Tax=Luteimonas sp. WGS1318 TaxID=3366815 RepID=UPI00372D628C